MQGGRATLKTRIITWNLGDNKHTQEEWASEIRKSWDIISKRDYDILGICVQEDWSQKYGKFGESVAAYLKDGYVMASNSLNGPPDITRQHFSVKVYVFIKKVK